MELYFGLLYGLIVAVNAGFIYWLFQRTRHLDAVNRHQAVIIRRLSVNAIEVSGKLTGLIEELKVREGKLNRFLLRLVKDNLSDLSRGGNGNGHRSKTVPLRQVNSQEDGETTIPRRGGMVSPVARRKP